MCQCTDLGVKPHTRARAVSTRAELNGQAWTVLWHARGPFGSCRIATCFDAWSAARTMRKADPDQ